MTSVLVHRIVNMLTKKFLYQLLVLIMAEASISMRLKLSARIPYVGKFWRGKILANERNLTFWMVKYWRM